MDHEPENRTHEGVVNAISKFNSKSSNDLYGLNRIPPMIMFPKFDLAKGYNLDYMHNALLGITNMLIDFWMGDNRLCAHSPYFSTIIPKNRSVLNQRLCSLKVCSYIKWKPRSLDQRGKFKAVEYRYLLLYYLRFALQGLLEKFADDFETLYGQEAVTMNVHLVRHYVDAVNDCGPLWSQSMFAMEKNIGNLKKAVTSSNDAIETISFHYCMTKNEVDDSNETEKLKKIILESQLSLTERNFLQEYFQSKYCSLIFSDSIELKGHTYKSLKSPKTKSIDHFIQMKGTKEMGCAKLFFESEGTLFVMIGLYKTVEKHYHLTRVMPSEQYKVFPTTQIECKLIFMKFGIFEIVAAEPNYFETT